MIEGLQAPIDAGLASATAPLPPPPEVSLPVTLSTTVTETSAALPTIIAEDDEFGDQLEWTEEMESQLADIEESHRAVVVLPTAPTPQPKSLWSAHFPSRAAKWKLIEGTPRQTHRWGGRLSVSDLIGPLWCEVQHSYRLKSKAYLRPEDRPATFVSASGATIAVDKVKTVQREMILDGGKAVHSILEKAVMGDTEQVEIVVTTPEDKWALRLVNLLVCLETLIQTGRAREIPVFGFVDTFLVTGVIDEVDRREIAPEATPNSAPPPPSIPRKTPSRKKPAKDEIAANQATLHQFFPPSSSLKGKDKEVQVAEEPTVEEDGGRIDDIAVPEPPPPRSHLGLVMSDTKTRHRNSLPPPADSRSSRLQLMIYHRLLSSLIATSSQPSTSTSPTIPFDWSAFYTRYQLSPTLPFSPAFMTSLSPVLIGSDLDGPLTESPNLEGVVRLLQLYGEMLPPLERFLEISYRLRGQAKVYTPKKTRKPPPPPTLGTRMSEEEEIELAIAIQNSLHDGPLKEGPEAGGDVTMETQEDPVVLDGKEEEEESMTQRLAEADDVLLSFPSFEEPSVDVAGPLAMLEDLPPNSQSVDTETSSVPITARYNLRRRSQLSPEAILSPPVGLKRPRDASSSSSPSRQDSAPPLPAPDVPRPTSPTPPPSSPEVEYLESGSLIGTETFLYDAGELETFLASSVALWKGEREAQGVDLQQTSRCRTCEFEANCEWLAKKGQEAAELNRANAAARRARTKT